MDAFITLSNLPQPLASVHARVSIACSEKMALALAAAIRRGERTCRAVAEDAIRRARSSKLNAFARVDAEAANRQLPDGPLRGVPLAVKDSICIKNETPSSTDRAKTPTQSVEEQ